MKVETFLILRKGRDLSVFPRLLKGILLADVVFCWFADINAFFSIFFSTFLRKKSVVVVGGYEVAYVPQMNYGMMLKRRYTYVVKWIFRFAHKILAVSEFSRQEIFDYASKGKVELVYHGIDCERFEPCGEKQKDLVLMVGPIKKDEIKIHGLDSFVEAAGLLPDVRFLAIGLDKDAMDHFSKSLSPNVTLMGVIPQEDLVVHYQKAKVYCQLSLRESFGVSLAEAMCCECVPVVSRNGGAMPEVVGDTGFFARFGNPGNIAQVINEALKSDKGRKARERIVKYFSVTIREIALANLIRKMMMSHNEENG